MGMSPGGDIWDCRQAATMVGCRQAATNGDVAGWRQREGGEEREEEAVEKPLHASKAERKGRKKGERK
jgi:hypothetical protein